MRITRAVSLLLSLTGLLLVIERGGVLAWAALACGLLMFTLSLVPSARVRPTIALTVAMLWVLAWAGTRYYVISTWESGEVVELTIATDLGAHTARTWVLDLDGAAVIYYDAEPEVVRALQSGRPLEFGRQGVVREQIPRTTLVDRMPAGEIARIFELMTAKYGDRNRATGVYYTMLGRSRDRVAVVISLTN